MPTYELVVWEVQSGERVRNREPMTIALESPPAVGQEFTADELPALEEQDVHFPVKVTAITDSDLDQYECAIHVEENPQGLAGPGSAAPQFNND
ncbi:hypothetical protein GCM10027040_10920 [Halomonas shantousis]